MGPLGRVIIPGDPAQFAGDLTRDRGRSVDELFRATQEQAGKSVLAEGKNYCKPMKNVICVQGMNGIIVGNKRESNHVASDSEEEKEEEIRLKRRRQEEEKATVREAHLATIEAKYCARMPENASMPDNL